MTGYRLLLDDWRGFVIGGFALVWIANIYMSVFARLRLVIKSERVDIKLKEEELQKEGEPQRTGRRRLASLRGRRGVFICRSISFFCSRASSSLRRLSRDVSRDQAATRVKRRRPGARNPRPARASADIQPPLSEESCDPAYSPLSRTSQAGRGSISELGVDVPPPPQLLPCLGRGRTTCAIASAHLPARDP